MIEAVVGWAAGWEWIGGAVGVVGALLGFLFSGWRKWLLVAIGLVAIGGYIAWTKVSLAKREAEVATLTAERDSARASAEAQARALKDLTERRKREQSAYGAEKRRLQEEADRANTQLNAIRRSRTANDPIPDALAPLLAPRGVQ